MGRVLEFKRQARTLRFCDGARNALLALTYRWPVVVNWTLTEDGHEMAVLDSECGRWMVAGCKPVAGGYALEDDHGRSIGVFQDVDDLRSALATRLPWPELCELTQTAQHPSLADQ